EAMLKAAEEARVVGIDRDKRAICRAQEKLAPFGGRVELHHCAFSELGALGEKGPFDGILADLGLSSDQLEDGRGMSFREDCPLDMRMNEEDETTAAEIVNEASAGDLTRILGRGGVRKNLKRYVSAILHGRPFASAIQLAEVISEATPFRDRRDRHPATVVFQALRMEVNREVQEIEALLEVVPQLISSGGRFACISFHSGEDQLITKRMRRWRGSGTPAMWGGGQQEEERSLGKLLTRNAITPSSEEIHENPRARSARMRVFEFC
ncbi:16S rRNA (cytosine(1402)-N(4))-methyltransferase RsmH, partial [bacterium]|nr:16S rRNA (cytosine(1402)-N(4))-methyltransferase RsmH [bacterium]